MAQRILLTDEQWTKIAPLLPKHPSRGRRGRRGRPRVPDREVFEGILWILWTGAPWSAMPDRYPSPSTCWRRLRDWEDDGTWLRIWRTFLAELDQEGLLEWSESFIDGTFVPAKKGGPTSERRSGGKAQSAWWWQTARVFLWETDFTRQPRRKSPSRKKR